MLSELDGIVQKIDNDLTQPVRITNQEGSGIGRSADMKI